MKNVLIIYNTNAGRKKAVIYKKKLQKFLLRNTESFKFVSIEELETSDTNYYDTIIAVGGDGTVSKAAGKAIECNKTLGIIPSGTANLLAEKLGIPLNFNEALKILKYENKRKIDVMKINDFYGVLRAGIGYDADIINKTPQSLKQKFGYFAYFIAGLIFALKLKQEEYILNLGNHALNVKASCIIVANAANMYHNLVSVADKSQPDDGLLDVFILTTTNPIGFFFEFLKIIFRNYKSNSRTMFFKTSKLIIKNEWINVHIDGEKTNFKESIYFNIEEKSLNIICSA